MIGNRGKGATLGSLAAMVVAAVVGFYVDAHRTVAEAREAPKAEVVAVEARLPVAEPACEAATPAVVRITAPHATL